MCVYLHYNTWGQGCISIYLLISPFWNIAFFPKKHTQKYERTVTTSQRDIYHISSCFGIMINMFTSKFLKVMGKKNPQKNTTENPTENRKSGQDRTVYHTHKGHLGCGTDRSWYVASAFRLAWTWFGVRGEGVTLSGCFNTPELEHTPT